MKIVLAKKRLYQILFALCIGVPYLNNYELTFAVWVLAVMVTINKNYSFTILQQAGCFLAIISIAFVVMFYHEYKPYYIIRDMSYMLKPILGLLLGYQLCKKNLKEAFQTVVYTALFIAIIHLIMLVLAVIIHSATTVNDLRLYGGYFSDFEVYALIILIFHKKFELGFSRKHTLFFMAIIGFSAFMYLARTNFIQFVILFIGMKGYYKINKTSITVILSVVILAIIGYSTVLYINPKRNGQGLEAFLYKIKVAPSETFKTKIKRDDFKDFNDNYRSFENIMTVRQVTREGYFPILFGQGLGSKIDLKQKVWLGDMELRYISILHNGFMTVFLKSGLLGVFFLIYSIYLLFKQKKTAIPIVNEINLLLIGSGLFLMVSYWVFMGFYFIADTKALLIGFLICYKEMALKNQKSLSVKND